MSPRYYIPYFYDGRDVKVRCRDGKWRKWKNTKGMGPCRSCVSLHTLKGAKRAANARFNKDSSVLSAGYVWTTDFNQDASWLVRAIKNNRDPR